MIDKNCKVCGKAFQVPRSEDARGWGIYCSPACRNYDKCKHVKLVCPICGIEFEAREKEVLEKNRRFCSQTCLIKHLRSEGSKTRIISLCLNCGTEISDPPSEVKRIYCSRQCMVDYWAKGHHPSYQGGISKRPGYNAAMRNRRRARKKAAPGAYTQAEWEALVIEYDSKCLMCGKPSTEVELTADHVVPLSKHGTNYIENIQPLCRSCNSKKNTKTISFK